MAATTVHSLVATHAATHSSAVFVYDTTATAPFGQASDLPAAPHATVFRMETRQGAGAALVGFVERMAFSSKGAQPTTGASPVAVLGSTATLLALVPSILALPDASVRSPVAIHVSAQTSSLAEDELTGPTLQQVPDLSSLLAATSALQPTFNGAIVLSETTAAAARVGTGLALSLASTGHDLIAVFDGLTVGRALSPLAATEPTTAGGDLKAVVGAFTPFFSYSGSASAKHVIVLPASASSAAAKAAVAATKSSQIGIVAIHVLAPWEPKELLKVLPQSAQALWVGQGLVDLVLEATLSSESSVKVRSLPALEEGQEKWSHVFETVSPSSAATPTVPLLPSPAKLAVFWGPDASAPLVPTALVQAFAEPDTGVYPSLQTSYDNFAGTGLSQSLLLLSTSSASIEHPVSAIAETSAPSVLFLSSPSAVLKSYNPLETIDKKTCVVLWTTWTAGDLATKLPSTAFNTLKNHPWLYLVDVDAIAKASHVPASAVAELVFWSLYLPKSLGPKEVLALLSGSKTFGTWSSSVLLKTYEKLNQGLSPAATPLQAAADAPVANGDVLRLPPLIRATAASPNDYKPEQTTATTSSWHSVAQRIIYPSLFSTSQALRPDLPDKTYLITVSENRRLTPSTYDRNVFHIEFDLAGTGLKYAIGEALGIHGWNDTQEVEEFLQWYGVDKDAIVEFPAKEGGGVIEQRTSFQVFQQNLDLFGKPPKSFYSELAKFASSKQEERALRFIGAPEGAATFKKWADVDFVTYADVLHKFPSAKPPVQALVGLIEEIKPRHYSISSSQNFVGDSVHLLVVTVEWDVSGKSRFGQCTRYLAGLKAGDQVTVSVKPSVMKLPGDDKAAIIMAGLGTGAAPFRAFIQERAWLAAQGKEIGPALYYFGSRHRSKEYLYGEEIEAYVREGIVSHTGLAFSRDTSAKVYIQHKMNEDAKLLASALQEGTFFLCGPTWPVPDVTTSLIQALMGEGRTEAEATARLEELKEAERYVLEVY